jgi:hypothetical protein
MDRKLALSAKSGDSPFRIAFRFGVIRMMLTSQHVDGLLHGCGHKEGASVIRQAVEVSRTVRRACRTGSLILIGLSLMATIASCGRTPSELKAQASKAANHCIKIGTAFAQSLQDCLHREAPFGPLVARETGKSTHVCYPAKLLGRCVATLKLKLILKIT